MQTQRGGYVKISDMKYLIGILIAAVLTVAAFAGFILLKDNKTPNDASTPASTNTTTQPKPSENATVLDLSNKGLTKVTSDIYSKTATTELILSNNGIKTLPSEIGKMTNVTIFKIDHNLLDGSLLGEIRQMSKLTQLDVSYNNMTGVPAELGQLSYLQTLNYSYNKIDNLPNELSNLKNNLKELDLTGNPLNPDKINKIKAQLPNTRIVF